MEKSENRWWDRLFIDDPPINVQTLDTAVNTSELSQEDHMKIQELVVGQDKRQNSSIVPNVTLNGTIFFMLCHRIDLICYCFRNKKNLWNKHGKLKDLLFKNFQLKI